VAAQVQQYKQISIVMALREQVANYSLRCMHMACCPTALQITHAPSPAHPPGLRCSLVMVPCSCQTTQILQSVRCVQTVLQAAVHCNVHISPVFQSQVDLNTYEVTTPYGSTPDIGQDWRDIDG
jgi:hypothetical protein